MSSPVPRFAVSTNISPTGASSGDMGYIIALTPGQSGAFRDFTISATDFWKVDNVAFEAQHADFQYAGGYGSNAATLGTTLIGNKYIPTFTYNFSGNGIGYAGFYYGAPPANSSVSSSHTFDFWSVSSGSVKFSATDHVGSSWTCTKAVVPGWQTFDIPWVGAAGVGYAPTSFTHPVSQFSVDAVSSMQTGQFMLDKSYYGTIQTMASLNPTYIGGPQYTLMEVDSGALPFDFYVNKIAVDQVTIDGSVNSPAAYHGIPRWTYKWFGSDVNIAYGAWRGPSAPGYLWLAGWTRTGLVNSDTSAVMADATLQFMYDAQQAYHTQFPTQGIGPYMPRYGRPAWEALTTDGYVSNSYTASTYGKWYHPGSDDWYGYEYRALLSVAAHYYYTANAQAKTILDNWMSWVDSYVLADGAYWKPPSNFYQDGTVGYTYKPVYAYACIAAACIYKYWVDGDAIALKWYRRLLDDIYARQRQVSTGSLLGMSKGSEGVHYNSASIIFTVNSGAVAPSATPVISGGKIVRCQVNSAGSGITSISAVFTGDGSGAVYTPFLTDAVLGAFATNPTGWEQAEIFNTYAMLINGPRPGGHANYAISVSGAGDLSSAAYTGKSWHVSSQTSYPAGLAFRPDGMAMYVTDANSGAVFEYSLPSAWDVNSANYTGKSFNVAAQDVDPRGIAFSPDGTRMFIAGGAGLKVYQYSLPTSWDVNSASYTGNALAVNSQDPKPRNIAINSAGTALLMVGYTNDTIFQYNVTSAWNIATAVYSGQFYWYGGHSWGSGLGVTTDGTKAFLFSPNSNAILEYDMSSAWNIATAVYSGHTLSVYSQDATVYGGAVDLAGGRFYVAGQTNKAVFEYSSTTSGSYSANDLAAFQGLYNFYTRSLSATARPAMLNSAWLPYHEFDIDPYHNNTGIENPMYEDYHVKGAMWTETLGPTLLAAAEYSRYSQTFSGTQNTTWLSNLYALVLEFTGQQGGSTFLTPTPRASNGLCDAYTDILGGEPLTRTYRGKLDGALYTVNGSHQIVIPASAGGGEVVYVRGVWPAGVNFRYDGFKSDVDPNYVGSHDNYANVYSGATAYNLYSGSEYTVVNLTTGINSGDLVQAYYAYRDGTYSQKGQALAEWPNLCVDSYQATANDGDNYLMMALALATDFTGDSKYVTTAARIGAALMDAGNWDGNTIPFNMPIDAVQGQFGFYSGHSSSTPFSLGVEAIPNDAARSAMRVRASVYPGATPTNAAWMGLWPSWAVNTTNAFSSFNISMMWYSASDITSLATDPNAIFDRQLIIGTSDYSAHVKQWPNIERKWDQLSPKTVNLSLANEDGAFNFYIDYPERMRNPITLSMGFKYAGMKTVYYGTVDAATFQGGAVDLTLVDKTRALTDRKVGDTTTPVYYTSSAYLVHDMAWIICTSMGGLSAITSTSNPDIDYTSFSSWSSVFSTDDVRVSGYFTGQKPLELLDAIRILTQSAIYEEGGKIKFSRFSLADSAQSTLDGATVLDNMATLDGRALINRSWVSGAYNPSSQSFGLTVFADDSASQLTYGLVENLVANQNMWLTDSVSTLNLAQRTIETYGDIQPTYRATTPMPFIMRNIGDVIHLVDSAFGIAADFRIMNEGFDMDKGTRYFDVNQTQFKQMFYLDSTQLDDAAHVLV